MPNNTLKIACYGEILWDVFPDKKRLGGAPLNVAMRLHSFGAAVGMISSLGNDALGKEASSLLESEGLDLSYIQRNKLPTGVVNVTLSKSGSAAYEIKENVAWDTIPWTEENAAFVSQADALILGSLAFRSIDPEMESGGTNLEALEVLLERSKFTIFDLNLRTPFYDLEMVIGLMEASQMVKMNDEELELIVIALGVEKESLEEEVRAVASITHTETLCVTLGSDGAMLLHKDKIYTQIGFPTKVVDTVGAGDSFLAALVFGLLSGETPDDTLEVACAVGSLVASKAGANPVVTNDEINNLLGFE